MSHPTGHIQQRVLESFGLDDDDGILDDLQQIPRVVRATGEALHETYQEIPEDSRQDLEAFVAGMGVTIGAGLTLLSATTMAMDVALEASLPRWAMTELHRIGVGVETVEDLLVEYLYHARYGTMRSATITRTIQRVLVKMLRTSMAPAALVGLAIALAAYGGTAALFFMPVAEMEKMENQIVKRAELAGRPLTWSDYRAKDDAITLLNFLGISMLTSEGRRIISGLTKSNAVGGGANTHAAIGPEILAGGMRMRNAIEEATDEAEAIIA